MQTILYQGKPGQQDRWLVIPPEFVKTYREHDYDVRELVLRDEVEREHTVSFNAGVEQAAQLVETKRPELAKMIRRQKKELPKVQA